jgi:hypothetical protein
MARVVATVAALLAVLLVVSPDVARASMSWSAPVTIDHAGGIRTMGVVCPSVSQCTVIDVNGRAITFDPASPATETTVDLDVSGDPAEYYFGGLDDLACPTVAQCTYVDQSGSEITFDPTDPTTPSPVTIDAGPLRPYGLPVG